MSWDQLRQEIEKRFSLHEIRTLCFDLGIDYDSIAGEEKSGKVRELLLFVRRTQREDELIAALSSTRPNVAWGNLLQAEQPVSPSAPPKPQPVTPKQPAPQQKDDKPPWWPWGDFPLVVILGVLASLVTIILAIPQFLNMAGLGADPTATTATAPSTTTEVTVPSIEPGALANTTAAQTATAVFVVEGTRAAATATAAVVPTVTTPPSLPASVVITSCSTTDCSSWIRITVDGTVVYEGIIRADEVLGYTVQQALLVRIGNPSAITIKINGIQRNFNQNTGQVLNFTWP